MFICLCLSINVYRYVDPENGVLVSLVLILFAI